jgi:hypothetical protein
MLDIFLNEVEMNENPIQEKIIKIPLVNKQKEIKC